MAKVIHLQLKESDTHYYFGSLRALTQCFPSEKIGVGYGYLRRQKLCQNHYFENDKCIIRQGDLIRAPKEE